MDKLICFCEKCKYTAKNNSDYKKHILTKKHLNTNETNSECNYQCSHCNKKYNSNSGLWRHKKKCKEIKKEKTDENDELREMIKQLILKQEGMKNDELRELIKQLILKQDGIENMIIQLSKNQPVPIINNNNNLNINLFLNEQCKNAINMIDFVKSIVFELKDFENIQDKGYIENKTNIILENLNKLTVYERPLHYIKNECNEEEKIIHIRDENQWKKESEDNKPILENALKELDNNEYDDLYKTIKVMGVSQRGKKMVDYDVNKFPNFPEVKEILEKEDNEETKNFIISSILKNVVYPIETK